MTDHPSPSSPLKPSLFLFLAAAALFACEGPAGQPCTLVNHGNGTATISCPDGTSVTVTSGTDGTDGTNGTSCTVHDNGDGTKTISCTDGTSVTVSDGTDGTNGTDANAIADFTTLSAAELAALDLSIQVTGVTDAAHPVVTFTVKDQKGHGIKGIPAADFQGFALLKLVPGDTAVSGNGMGNDTWVSYIANCQTCRATTETANATTLHDNGDGSYTYTFAKDVQNTVSGNSPGTTYDANAVTRLTIRLVASGNPFRPVNIAYDYVPATGADVTGQNEKVDTNNCLECHGQLRANANNVGGTMMFHSGQRYTVPVCISCHNDQRKYSGTLNTGNAVSPEPAIDTSTGNMAMPDGGSISVLRGQAVIDTPVWIHKIHRGEELFLKGNYAGLHTEMNEITYPQDLRNCTKCHRNAAQADNWKNKPSRRACGACHDDIDWATGTGHLAGAQADDRGCLGCHGPTAPYAVAKMHVPVRKAAGASAYIGNPANAPTGANFVTYKIASAGVSTAVGADGGVNPTVKFQFVDKNGQPIAFNPYDSTDAGYLGTSLFNGFVGSPSIYCAYAVPEDGITAPADFNVSTSAYIPNLWKGNGGSLTASSGYYVAQLAGANIPASATMLTCGIGFSSGTGTSQQLTETDLPEYPYDPATKDGGLVLPAPIVWQVATGYTGRRGSSMSTSTTGQIANPAKCNGCHAPLGVAPDFHGSQRNDPATCSFCHTPNRTSSGWSAQSTAFIHGIHGASKRTVPYTWHAVSSTQGYYEITYPGVLQMCEQCHNPGYYDFSASWYTANGGANLANRPYQTVATGKFDPANASAYRFSPYIVADNTTDYGAGFLWDAATNTATPAAPTTLVNSPIAGVCFSCHDSDIDVDHMRSNGGSIYEARSTALPKQEGCLLCHGPGKVAAIKDVHYQ